MTSLEQQLRSSKNEGEILKKDQNVALQSVQKQLSDSEQRVKELKEKMSKLNGKSKCMSEELESEKNAYIKLKKELVDLEKQRTAESRKAALELSKLKVCTYILLYQSSKLYMHCNGIDLSLFLHTYVRTYVVLEIRNRLCLDKCPSTIILDQTNSILLGQFMEKIHVCYSKHT